MCQSCSNHNYATRQHCNKCQCRRPDAPDDSRPGDWRCRGCGGNNYKSKTHCFKCREPKSGSTTTMANFRPGDWLCPSCNNHNYSQRDSCNKCRMSRMQAQMLAHQQPQGQPLPHTARPGDWMCNSCGNHNYASRMDCNRCKAGKGTGAPAQQYATQQYGVQQVWAQPQQQTHVFPRSARPGDWMCTACGNHNYASREKCNSCQSPKGLTPTAPTQTYATQQWAVPQQGPPLPNSARPGDWMCSSCGNHNYASREACNKCQAARIAAGGVGVAAAGYGAQAGWSGATWSPYGNTAMAQPIMMGVQNTGGNRGSDRPGDWKCASCNYHNYANRTDCKRCNAAKATKEGDDTAEAAAPTATTDFKLT